MLRERIRDRVRQLGKTYEDGNSDTVGYTYHPIPFEEFNNIKRHRDVCQDRLQAILAEVEIKSGDWILDVGANVGYFSFSLEKMGAYVDAYELNSDSFEIGAALSKLYKKNVIYINKPMSVATLCYLRPKYKIILLLSVFHWIFKQEGDGGAAIVLKNLASRSDYIFFEVPSSLDDAMYKHEHFSSQRSVERYLTSVLPNVQLSQLIQDGKWGGRILYKIDCRDLH